MPIRTLHSSFQLRPNEPRTLNEYESILNESGDETLKFELLIEALNRRMTAEVDAIDLSTCFDLIREYFDLSTEWWRDVFPLGADRDRTTFPRALLNFANRVQRILRDKLEILRLRIGELFILFHNHQSYYGLWYVKDENTVEIARDMVNLYENEWVYHLEVFTHFYRWNNTPVDDIMEDNFRKVYYRVQRARRELPIVNLE
jgi:hypothetical protein